MAIKSKRWTASLPVKICCVILVIVMAFVFLYGCLGFIRMDTGALTWELIFSDLNEGSYFFDRYVPLAVSQTQTVLGYRSEEHIRAMGCLEWEPLGSYIDKDGNEEQTMRLVSTNDAGTWLSMGDLRVSELDGPEAERMIQEAISIQLREYKSAREWLDTTEGLYYHVSDGTNVLSNASKQDADFFRKQPVYAIQDGDKWEQSAKEVSIAYSYSYDYGYYYLGGYESWSSYIAFSQEAVSAQNAEWKEVQQQFARQAGVVGAAAVICLALIIILLAGAGRRYGDSERTVYFIALDKPWLDFGLALLICYETAICIFSYDAAEAAWRYGNIRGLILLFGLMAAGFMLPLLWWLCGFTKRCKAGKWWRHTLIYWIYSKIKDFIKSLWAGFSLTAKAVLIALAALAAMIICAVAWPLCFVFAILTALIIMRYFRKLYLLERGAKAVGDGDCDTRITVTGGELGRIAASINRMSDGIGDAVIERMKSERLKTELITNVSHDIRTPLTSLITYTDLLKTEGLQSEKAPEYLEVLIQKSARLKNLTDDLFEASKAASGNVEVSLATLDLSDFIRQVLGELDERVQNSGLDFRLNLPERAPVRADGKLLWRVMENLLSNVFKYALKGSRVYIDVSEENGDYLMEIKNISEHPLNVEPAELTERFKRGDSARADEGSGLGLSIAQSFVTAQGGRFNLSIDGDLFKAALHLPKDYGKER